MENAWIQGSKGGFKVQKRQSKTKTRAVSLSKHINVAIVGCVFQSDDIFCLSICEHVIFSENHVTVSMMLLSRHTILTFPNVNCYKLKI